MRLSGAAPSGASVPRNQAGAASEDPDTAAKQNALLPALSFVGKFPEVPAGGDNTNKRSVQNSGLSLSLTLE